MINTSNIKTKTFFSFGLFSKSKNSHLLISLAKKLKDKNADFKVGRRKKDLSGGNRAGLDRSKPSDEMLSHAAFEQHLASCSAILMFLTLIFSSLRFQVLY